MAENKSQAAVALGKLRWAGVSDEDRAAHGRMMASRRWRKKKRPLLKKPLTS